MPIEQRHVFGRERVGLGQNPLGHSDLPHVVQQGSDLDVVELLVGKPQRDSPTRAAQRDAQTMRGGAGVFAAEGREQASGHTQTRLNEPVLMGDVAGGVR